EMRGFPQPLQRGCGRGEPGRARQSATTTMRSRCAGRGHRARPPVPRSLWLKARVCGNPAALVRVRADARAAGLGQRGGEPTRRFAMKALVYGGPGERSWETVPDPTIQEPTDAVVRIDTATICGTDLHILKGDVPEVTPGTILGHEAVGTVVE